MSGLVVDTSAIVAILSREPGGEWLAAELASATARQITAATALELGIVLEARRSKSVGIATRALRDSDVRIVPFDEDLAGRALEGWRRFGRGRHAAGLNFGDCTTYALAARSGFPILCVGDDFSRTDLPVRRPPPP